MFYDIVSLLSLCLWPVSPLLWICGSVGVVHGSWWTIVVVVVVVLSLPIVEVWSVVV